MEHYHNICEYFTNNRFSIVLNFLSTVIGAFLGFLFALIIYWLGNNLNRKTKKQVEREKAYNILRRFSLLIQSVVKTCRIQNDSFHNYASELLKRPLFFHLPELLATNDRGRLVKSDNIELYLSIMFFDKKNENKYKDYKNIFNNADFLERFYTDLFTQSEKHQNFLHSDLKVIRDDLLAIAIRITLIQKNIQLEKPKDYAQNSEFQFLEKYKSIYVGLKGTGFTDLEPYRDNFLIPLQCELFENISNQDQADEIASHITDAIARMENILANVEAHAANFEKLDEDVNVNSALTYLEEFKEKIDELIE